jgi:hypothetical protein
MSAVTRPRGPLPARVYWTRRMVLLAVALLLVVGLARLLGGGSDGKSDDGDTAEVASSGQYDRPTRTTTTRPAGTKTKTRAPLAEPDGPCDPEDLTVEARVTREPNDGDVRIPLVLHGKQAACTFSVSSRSIVAKIVSGDDFIWSSQQCPTIKPRDVVVRSARGVKVTVVWSGRRSDPECSASTNWADVGDYHLIVATLGGEPTDTQFTLTRPPAERITITPDPTPSTKTPSTNRSRR